MSIDPQRLKYAVLFSKFTERHFTKSFLKKYKEKGWRVTQDAIEAVCANPERAIERKKLETIVDAGDVLICKLNFAVAGTRRSPKASGNRAIVAVHKQEKISRILLIYHKSDLGKGNETQKWKKLIRLHFSEYKEVLQ